MSDPVLLRPPFRPFSLEELDRIYARNLPHWRQPGATYWLTTRLADSVPANVLREWEYDRRVWLKARGIEVSGRSVRWQDIAHRLSAADRHRFRRHFEQRMERYLDTGWGACHLANAECVRIVRECLLSGDGETHHMGDFVVMPNHVHMLVVPVTGHRLEDLLKRWKGATAVECNRALVRHGAFWRHETFDHIVRSLEHLAAYREYIRDNPAKAGIEVSPLAYYRASWMDAWFRG